LIADAGVLIVFARAGRLPLLRRLFSTGDVPPAVRRECLAAKEAPDAGALLSAMSTGWIRVRRPPSRAEAILRRRYPNLGRGEVAAIAIARGVREREILLDDSLARRAARLEGLTPVGSLGVLARAHRRGVLRRDQVARALGDLLAAGLWMAPDVIESFWAALGGRR
jgi:predicted nucleic acid-binding protein